MPRQLLIQTLEESWTDRDFILLHACFQCLTDCVEQENLLDGHVSWDHDDKVRDVHQELATLYKWWKTRAVVLAAKTGVINTLHSDEYKADNQMLIRLIKVRGYVWA